MKNKKRWRRLCCDEIKKRNLIGEMRAKNHGLQFGYFWPFESSGSIVWKAVK